MKLSINQASCISEVEKPWGRELILADNELYAGKILIVNKGCRTSLQYHGDKDETFYLYSGKIVVEIEGKKISPSHNESIRIRPNVVHRITAIESSIIIEVSTPHKGTVRLEDDYGRQNSSG
jgi:mannose-6-phosphate isomerase